MKREEMRKKRKITLYKKVPHDYKQKYMYVTLDEKKAMKQANKGADNIVLNKNKNASENSASLVWKLRPLDFNSNHTDYEGMLKRLISRGVIAPIDSLSANLENQSQTDKFARVQRSRKRDRSSAVKTSQLSSNGRISPSVMTSDEADYSKNDYDNHSQRSVSNKLNSNTLSEFSYRQDPTILRWQSS